MTGESLRSLTRPLRRETHISPEVVGSHGNSTLRHNNSRYPISSNPTLTATPSKRNPPKRAPTTAPPGLPARKSRARDRRCSPVARDSRVGACLSDSHRGNLHLCTQTRLNQLARGYGSHFTIPPGKRTWSRGREEHGIRRTPRQKDRKEGTGFYRCPPTPCDQASLTRQGQQHEPVWLTRSRLWAEPRSEAGRSSSSS